MKILRSILMVSAAALITGYALMEMYPNWMLPVPAAAQAGVPTGAAWTAVGATGIVDESALSLFGFTGPYVHYRSGSLSLNPIELRYNVVNTNHAGHSVAVPSWTKLELGAYAPGTSLAEAVLYRVSRCNGYYNIVCRTQVYNTPLTAGSACNTCDIPAGSVNFTSYLYYVQVTMKRHTTSERPKINTLRIY